MNKSSFVWLFAMLLVVGGVNAVVSDNLLTYYNLDDTTATVIDSAGRINGTIFGAVTNATGILSTAKNGTGVIGRNITFAESAYNEPPNSFSISLWIYPTVTPASSKMWVDKDRTTVTNTGYELFSSASGVLNFYVGLGGSSRTATTTSIPTNNTWNHVVVAFNASNGTAMIYLNGALAATGTGGAANPSYGSAPLTLFQTSGGTFPANSSIDELATFNRTLTPTDVSVLYNSGAACGYANLSTSTTSCIGQTYFSITARNNYSSSSISVFNATINGTFYSTTNGTIVTNINNSVGATSYLINITAVDANNYFTGQLLNVNTSSNQQINLTPYTEIRAVSALTGTAINNFTIDYINDADSTENGTTSTTNGTAYVPLYNAVYTVNISDAHNLSTTYADASATITANPYNQSYNFSLYTSESITFYFYDEVTNRLINTTNVSVGLSSTMYGTNFTTSNGTYYIDLLTPANYTITYNATGYNQRQYFYTVTDDSTTILYLYLRPSANSTVVLVQVRDESLEKVVGAYVNVNVQNLSGTSDYLVEMCQTDINGQCLISADVSTSTYLAPTWYRFTVVYDGVTVGDSQYTKISSTANSACNSDLPCIQLAVSLGENPLQTFFELPSIQYSLSNSSNNFTFTVNDVYGNVQQTCLLLYMRTGSTLTLTNSSCVASASTTITLFSNVSLGDETIARGVVYIEDQQTVLDSISVPVSGAGASGDANFLIFVLVGVGLTVFFGYRQLASLALVMLGATVLILFRTYGFNLATGAVTAILLILLFVLARMRE